jgi:hypothetical protein
MRLLLAVIVSLWAASPTWADCPGDSYGTGVVRTLDLVNAKTDADLMVSMSMMPKLLHMDYQTEFPRHLSCRLSGFEADALQYELRGDDITAGTRRIASSDKLGAPIAELIPVTNILDAIASSKLGKTAPISGYMLATLSKDDFTGWRLYTGIPNQVSLSADMMAALSGKMQPLFRNNTRTGKTELFVRGE